MATAKKVAAKVAEVVKTKPAAEAAPSLPALVHASPAPDQPIPPWHAEVMRLADAMSDKFGVWRYCADKGRSQLTQDNAQREYEAARVALQDYLRANG
jgi:predicted secreted protein